MIRQDIENGMVLFDERDYWNCDEDGERREAGDDEADRIWKEEQEERLRNEGRKN